MTAAIILLVNGVFNWIVWPPFYRRTASDPRAHDADGKATRFLRIHAILIGAALLLAVVSLVIGVLALFRVV
ncbi:MAG TPA: hypothetical protein VK537_01405 [Galbitalea sp.]|nr:hypothetical protein [Galbitalea sp.]